MRFSAKKFVITLLSYELTAFVASIIIFRQHYIIIGHLVGFLFVATFFLLSVIEKRKKFKITSFLYWYGALSVLALASGFWAIDISTATHTASQMIYLLIYLFVTYNVLRLFRIEKYFLYGIFFGAVVNYLLLFNLYSPSFEIYVGWRPVGTMGNANVLALLLDFTIFASMIYLYLYKPTGIIALFHTINIFIAFYMIIMTASKKGVILGVVLIAVFMFLHRKNIKEIVLMAFFTGIFFVFFQSSIDFSDAQHYLELLFRRFSTFSEQIEGNDYFGSTAQRLSFIKLGLELFSDKPIFGYGIDNFRVFGGTYAHNNYIEILADLGLAGFSLLLLMYFSIFQKIKNVSKTTLKYYLFIIMTGYLLLDMAMVSYSNKIILFELIFLVALAENQFFDGCEKESLRTVSAT